MELDSHEELDNHLLAQARSRGGRWSWALKVGQPFASVVSQQLLYGNCLRDSIPHSG